MKSLRVHRVRRLIEASSASMSCFAEMLGAVSDAILAPLVRRAVKVTVPSTMCEQLPRVQCSLQIIPRWILSDSIIATTDIET